MSEYEAFQQRVLRGTIAVWRDDMLARFNRAASEGSILLYGRFEKMGSPFVRLPPDIWPQVEVHDWEKGNAKAGDGTDIWSIHAGTVAPSPSSRAGRKPVYDQDYINAKVLEAVKKMGFPTPNGEIGWQSAADVGRLVRDFCLETKGQEPAISTVQGFVRKALIAAKAKLNSGN